MCFPGELSPECSLVLFSGGTLWVPRSRARLWDPGPESGTATALSATAASVRGPGGSRTSERCRLPLGQEAAVRSSPGHLLGPLGAEAQPGACPGSRHSDPGHWRCHFCDARGGCWAAGLGSRGSGRTLAPCSDSEHCACCMTCGLPRGHCLLLWKATRRQQPVLVEPASAGCVGPGRAAGSPASRVSGRVPLVGLGNSLPFTQAGV